MEGSKRTTTRIGHLSSSTKKQAKKQKRYNFMTESLLTNNISNRFKLIILQICGKTYSLCRRNGTITLPSGKVRTVENMVW